MVGDKRAPSFYEKFMVKAKKDPLVPVGALATVGFLVSGTSTRTQRSQRGDVYHNTAVGSVCLRAQQYVYMLAASLYCCRSCVLLYVRVVCRFATQSEAVRQCVIPALVFCLIFLTVCPLQLLYSYEVRVLIGGVIIARNSSTAVT